MGQKEKRQGDIARREPQRGEGTEGENTGREDTARREPQREERGDRRKRHG